MELVASALPIFMDDTDYSLSFQDGLLCDSSGSKAAGAMKSLLFDPCVQDEAEHCYSFYRDIGFAADRLLMQKYDFRYDITVIMPGLINGERKKTSGHYHGYIDGRCSTYPEIYEVLKGRALYILQKVRNFDRDEEPVIEDLKAVFVEEGQAIVIPPFYGHCSINAGDGPLAFSNIAVVSCPLHYAPIKSKQGLSLYALSDGTGSGIRLVKNPRYRAVPDPVIVHPRDNADMGIRFGHSVYKEFAARPEAFAYLLNPDGYVRQMEEML